MLPNAEGSIRLIPMTRFSLPVREWESHYGRQMQSSADCVSELACDAPMEDVFNRDFMTFVMPSLCIA
jgi:hypothetical protein